MNEAFLSFANGIASPLLRHRPDLEKARSSAVTMRNLIPLPYGAMVKRPGLLDVRTTTETADENTKLFPFVSSDGSEYLIHVTPDVLKVYAVDGTGKASKDFMLSFSWPSSPWENGIRALQIVQLNDVAFLVHPGTFPLRLQRASDTTWGLQFIPFPKAPPMKDENTRKAKTFTVASDPVAPDWTSGETYAADDVVFTDSEWICTADHESSAANKPGYGANWRDYWRRMLYQEDDPVTILCDDREQVAWDYKYRTYYPGDVVRDTDNAGVFSDFDGGEGFLETQYSEVYYNHYCISEITVTSYDDIDDTDHFVPLNAWNYSPYSGWDPTITAGDYYVREGNIYRCTVTHSKTDQYPNPGDYHPYAPGAGAYWETKWSLIGPMSYDEKPVFKVSYNYTVGEKVSRKGRVFQCILTHEPTDSNKPGSGASWETYWTEVSRIIESFASDDFSPGMYFRISPERDSEDFQISQDLLAANDGIASDPIAVQGAWNINTYGTWWGKVKIQRSSTNGRTWSAYKTYEANGDRNIAASGFEDTPVLLRLKFEYVDGGDQEDDVLTANPDTPARAVLAPESASITGYALCDTYVSADEMTGTAKTAMMSGNTYRWAECEFNSRDGFPRAVALHEGRLVFAGTSAKPVSLWLSASDDFTNFETGVEDDDSISATLALTNASPIRWLVSQRRLFIGTKYGEWVAGSETSDSPLTPTNFLARHYSAYGSHATQPVIAQGSAFFLERKGQRLRELAYNDAAGSYDANNLTRFAPDLTRDGIAAIAWQQTAEPALWAVTRDGVLLHFAYDKSERIAAWTSHQTASGVFLDVAVIPSDDGDDSVFFLIDRSGETHIERLPANWMADIEAGELVSFVDEVPDEAVTASYTSLPIDAPTGETCASRKRIRRVKLSLYRSEGGELWTADFSKRQAIPYTSAGSFTGWIDVIPDAGHEIDAQLHLWHDTDAPFLVRAAVVQVEVVGRD